MLRTLLQIDIDTLEVNGFDIQILKDCSVIKNGDEPFINSNTAILLVKSGGLRMRLREVCMELSAQDLVVLTKGQAVEIIEISPKLPMGVGTKYNIPAMVMLLYDKWIYSIRSGFRFCRTELPRR